MSPLTAKPEPGSVAEEIVRLEPPEFDSVSTCVWLAPIWTLPRFILEGAFRYPGVVLGEYPVPESRTVAPPECCR